MKISDLETIITEITEITTIIKTDYPELYKYLDEAPITIPAFEHLNMDKK